MSEISHKIFTVIPPVDRPDLRPHFEAIAAVNGWRILYPATENTTGETAIVEFRVHSLAEGEAA